MKFYLKVLRNALILGVGLFFTMWATQDIDMQFWKTILLYLGGYVVAELGRFYHVNYPAVPTKKKVPICPLIFA
jgi:hypothetical protein